MALRDRLRNGPVATAIPAIRATDSVAQGQPVAKIAAVAVATKAQPATAEAAEIRGHLGRLCGFDHPDYAEALELALADPVAALDAFRADGIVTPTPHLITSRERELRERAPGNIIAWQRELRGAA